MANKTKKKRSFRWIKLLVLLLVALCLTRLAGQLRQYSALDAEAAEYRAELAMAEAEYQDKLEQIELLSNDAYIERLARSRLGMVKQGECVVLSVDASRPVAEAVSDELDTTLRD